MNAKRGDVIIFKSPLDGKKDFIKRLIGLPNETVEIKNGFIFIDGKRIDDPLIRKQYYTNYGDYGKIDQKIIVPEDCYFVLGDNSENSRDSRYWGFLEKKKLRGKALLVYWPLNKMRIIR